MHLNALADKLRLDHIAVKCLDNQKRDDGRNHYLILAFHNGDQDNAGVADKRSQVRHQVCKPGKKSDNRCQTDAGQHHRGACRQDHKRHIHQLPPDITGKYLIHII